MLDIEDMSTINCVELNLTEDEYINQVYGEFHKYITYITFTTSSGRYVEAGVPKASHKKVKLQHFKWRFESPTYLIGFNVAFKKLIVGLSAVTLK